MPADKYQGKCDTCGPRRLMVIAEDSHNLMKSSISNLATETDYWDRSSSHTQFNPIQFTIHELISSVEPGGGVGTQANRLPS